MGLVALLASGLLMTGCGQKGPLFIKPAEAQRAPAAGTASIQGSPSTPAASSSTR